MSKKIIFGSLMIVLAIAALTFALMNYFAEQDNKQNGIKELFQVHYAYSQDKDADQVYLTMLGGYNEYAFADNSELLKDISSLKIDYSRVEDKYKELATTAIPFYYVEHVVKDVSSTDYSDSIYGVAGLEEMVLNELDYAPQVESNDNIFSSELSESNGFAGILSRGYFATVNDQNILNLGGSLSGTIIANDQVRNAVFNSNFNSNQLADLQPIFQSKLTSNSADVFKSGEGLRIYDIEKIGDGESFIDEGNNISNTLGADQNSTLIVNNLEIEYYYDWQEGYLIPLLNVECTVDSALGKDIEYWIWFVD